MSKGVLSTRLACIDGHLPSHHLLKAPQELLGEILNDYISLCAHHLLNDLGGKYPWVAAYRLGPTLLAIATYRAFDLAFGGFQL